MTPLEQLDAGWRWYQAARNSLRRVHRLGEKYWDSLPWDGPLGRDAQLQHVESEAARDDALAAQERLDDLAIIELFSIFEGAVRTAVLDQLRPAVTSLTHPVLKGAAREAIDGVDKRSFAAVLNSYSRAGDPRAADMAEKVRQVRRYRNWLSHGRRGNPVSRVEPRDAYDRLREFLAFVTPPLP